MFHIYLPLVAEVLLLKCYPQEENLDKTERCQFVPEVYNMCAVNPGRWAE